VSEATARIRREDVPPISNLALALSPGVWKQEFPGLRVRDLDDGAPIYRRGEAVDCVYVIESGYVRVTAPGGRGRDVTSAILSERHAFGPALEGTVRAGDSAFAKGPVRVYRVPGAEFRRAIALGSPFATRSLKIFRARQHVLARRLEHLAPLPAQQRVLATLAELLVHHGTPCGHGEVMHIRLGVRELADLAGAIQPQVRMTLSTLRQRGFVHSTHDFICVSKLQVLLRLLRRRRLLLPNRPIG
jgi:CRP-like cAMP-binding protein